MSRYFFGPRAIGRAASSFKRRFLYGIGRNRRAPAPAQATAQPATYGKTATAHYGASRTTGTKRTKRTVGRNDWAARAGAAKEKLREKVYGTPGTKTADDGLAERVRTAGTPQTQVMAQAGAYLPHIPPGSAYDTERAAYGMAAGVYGDSGLLDRVQTAGTPETLRMARGGSMEFQMAPGRGTYGWSGAEMGTDAQTARVGYERDFAGQQQAQQEAMNPANIFTASYGNPEMGQQNLQMPGPDVRLPDGTEAQWAFTQLVVQLGYINPTWNRFQINEAAKAKLMEMFQKGRGFSYGRL